MNKLFIVVLIFFFSIMLRLWNLNQMGRTWDEPFYVESGHKLITLIKNRDFANSFWHGLPSDPPLAKYTYGIASFLDVNKYDSKGKPIFNYDYTYTRLVSVLFSSLSAVMVVLIGWKYISPFVGVASGFILSMLPFFLGFSQLSTLESFIMFFFTASMFSFFNYLSTLSKKYILLTGILLGLSVGVKLTNILLYPLIIWVYFIWYYNVGYRKKIHLYKEIIVVFLVSFLTFFVLWPMPWLHLLEVIDQTLELRSSKYSVPEVFFGRLILVPKIYYVVHFLITTPLLILALFCVGLKHISDKKKWILYSLVAWFIFPFIQSLYNFRQHGVRYIIEIYAPLSLIAAIGIDYTVSRFTKSVKRKLLYFVPVVIYMFAILIKITPYYLDYFNGIVGGTKGVYEKKLFQLGWWGQGIKEGTLYLDKNATKGSTVGLAVSPLHVVPPVKRIQMLKHDEYKSYDYVMVSYFMVVREGFDDSSIKKNYNLVHSVSADGASLIDVYKRKVGNM